MAKTESTAVTEFINSVRSQPIDGYNGVNSARATDMRIRNQAGPALPAPNRQAAGTPAPVWATPPAARAQGTMPPSPRTTATMSPPPLPARVTASRPAVRVPSQLIVPEHLQATEAELELIDDTAEQPKLEAAELSPPATQYTAPMERTWFDAPQEQIDALDIPDFGNEGNDEDDDLDVSIDFEKPARRKLGLIALGGLVAVGGIATAAYIAFSGGNLQKGAPATAAQAVAPASSDPIPAATPVTPLAAPAIADEEAAAAPALPQGVVLHRANFTSEPIGATVTLVMNGRPVVLGASPVDAQLDPTKSYEVVFTMPGRETVLRSVAFDDTGVIAMNVELGAASEPAEAVATAEPEAAAIETEPAAEPAPEPAPVTRKARSSKKSRAERRSTRSRSKSKKTATAAIPSGTGLLMLNAKPPCDIYIDGKSIGQKTPQRALALEPGKHKIGLLNKTYGIKAAFSVTIKAGEKTRVIKDMTDRM
jgi:hypothetical protein